MTAYVRTNRRAECPVRLERSARGDPLFQDLSLLDGKLFVKIGRRHDFISIVAIQTPNQFAGIQISRLHHTGHSGSGVQSQISLSLSFIGTVAGKAMVGKDRPDIAMEIGNIRGQWTTEVGKKPSNKQNPN